MTLYELTRKLVARGCEEHPRLTWLQGFPLLAVGDGRVNAGITEADARDLWTSHALRWVLHPMTLLKKNTNVEYSLPNGHRVTPDVVAFIGSLAYMPQGEWLTAIEAATRHLEPTNAKA